MYFLKMGSIMERIDDYEAAITFYKQAFSLEPLDSGVSYFIHNNLGYCLNRVKRHSEAEPYCLAAIKIGYG
jgi:tetratricopeptide (TPR) repeat protein